MEQGNRTEYRCRKCCNACRCGVCCPRRVAVSEREAVLLDRLAVLPFLPLVRHPETGAAVILDAEMDTKADMVAMESLRRKGLVRMDEERPVFRADYSGYEGWIRGSVSLTAAGQDLLDILEYGGGFRDAGEGF